jgi:hypothetical protein
VILTIDLPPIAILAIDFIFYFFPSLPAAASACGLVIAVLEAMKNTRIPGIYAGFSQ